MKKKSWFERLKVCWYALTYRNFFFVAYKSDKNLLIENEQEEICGVREKSIHGYYHIDNVLYEGNISTLRNLLCDNMINIINKIKSNEL